MKTEKPIIYINPCHGNEPYILGALIADGVAQKLRERDGVEPLLVVPHLYGERQEQIISGLGLSAKIHLDKRLGEFYQPLLFQNNDFAAHLSNLVSQQKQVQEETRKHLYDTYGKIFSEINIASRISSSAPAWYAFPTIISELLTRTAQEEELCRTFPLRTLEQAIFIMENVEQNISAFFIPAYHTFSYDGKRVPHQKEISTPPLKPEPKINADKIPENSVYCMLSGTGSEIETMLQNARGLAEKGHHIIVPPWAGNTAFERRTPEIISNDNIVKVIGRAGWGTLWTCQVAGKDFEAVPYTPGDDPEIYFNLKTLQEVPMKQATEKQREMFGTLDGIEFVVEKIVGEII